MKNMLLWLTGCFLVTLFCGLVYVSVQQTLRLSANDPQIQIATDVKNSLESGLDPEELPYSKIDAGKSLSPFVIVYDNTGKEVKSFGEIDGKSPILPQGVLDAANRNGINKVTWQPNPNVREAAVILKYKDGFVLSARSLKEVEIRENLVFEYALFAWVLGIGAVSFVFVILHFSGKGKKK